MAGERFLQFIRYLGVSGQQSRNLAAVLNVCARQEVSRELKENPFFFNVMLRPADENFGCRKQNVLTFRARGTVVTRRLRWRLLWI